MGPLGRSRRVGRRRGLAAGAMIGSSVARHNQSRQDNSNMNEQVGPQNDSTATADQIAELEKLGELKDKGILTDEEFRAKKKEILG